MIKGDVMREQDAILFIHGAWVTPLCWRYFEPLFAARGFRTLAPAWPYKEKPIADQLTHPDARLGRTGIPEIVAHFKRIICGQARPPVLIGHSFGGLIVQILLDQGFAAGGIAINSVPPRGVAPARFLAPNPLRRLRLLFGTPFSWRKALFPPELDADEAALAQANGIQVHLVPESGRIFWQLFSAAARVDFRNGQRAPLLLVAGGKDRCIPAETQRRNREAYRESKARTDFALFPELTHLSIAEPGREALAAYCADWAAACFAERAAREPEVRALDACAG